MILEKNKVEGFTLSDFKIYYKATIMLTMWHWQNDRYKDQGDSPEIDSYMWSTDF